MGRFIGIVFPLWALLILALLSAYDSGFVARAWHDIIYNLEKKK